MAVYSHKRSLVNNFIGGKYFSNIFSEQKFIMELVKTEETKKDAFYITS